jgi:thioredoxin-related protein
MILEKKNNEIILRLPASMDITVLQKIINYVKYKESIKNSQATEKQINELAEESKMTWWKENKSKYIK